MTASQSAELLPAVQRYVLFRKKAVIAGDVAVLHQEYPDLKRGTDKVSGINAEAEAVAQYQWLNVIDGKIDLQGYDQPLAKIDENTAVVLINGREEYGGKSGNGSSGQQIQLLLYLERRAGAWTVVKTDETTLAEYHQALH